MYENTIAHTLLYIYECAVNAQWMLLNYVSYIIHWGRTPCTRVYFAAICPRRRPLYCIQYT